MEQSLLLVVGKVMLKVGRRRRRGVHSRGVLAAAVVHHGVVVVVRNDAVEKYKTRDR